MYRIVVFLLAFVSSAHPALADLIENGTLTTRDLAQHQFTLYERSARYSADDIDHENPRIFGRASTAFDSQYGRLFYGFDAQPDSTLLATGWANGKLTLGFSGGSTVASNAKLPQFSDSLNRNFHSAASNWRRLSLGWKAGSNLELTGGIARIDLTGRANAAVLETGFTTPHWSARLAQIQRKRDLLGHQIQAGWQTHRASISYAGFSDTGGHAVHAIQLARAAGKNSAAGLSLQSGVSPLTGLADHRMMFQWVYAPHVGRGDAPALAFENGALNFMKNMLIAGGIIAGAVAIASSSGKADGAEGGFTSTRDAARAALNKVNPSSVRENREYGGWVYQAKGDSYSYTPAQSGTIDKVSLGPKPNAAQASYHTHGAPNSGYDGEHFSSSDIRSDNQQGVDGYLGTPLGKFLYYNRSSGQISQVGTIATR